MAGTGANGTRHQRGQLLASRAQVGRASLHLAPLWHAYSYACTRQGVSRNRERIDDARWGSGNRNNEEGFLMRNGSETTEAWTGLVNNDINHVWNHGPAMKITQQLGSTPIPTAKEIDGIYLDKNYDEATEWLKLFKQDWKNYGVTVMCDSWTGPAEFLYREIKKVVVEEIGHETVVQIVTDNGSNYKKACKTLVEQPEYDHIVWQPCAAHTVNLMLKDMAKFPEVDVIVKSAKQICRFFHNHNNLHDSMKKNVGGELIKPNATRFGTVFMFLQSYHEKKNQFRKWMVSDNWKECIWKDDPDYVFAEELLSSNMWWAALEWVLHMLEPLYKALRYADTRKKCTLSGFKKSMMSAVQDMGSHLGAGLAMFHRVMSKVSKRIDAMQKDTLMVAADVLDPYTHYQINMSNIPEFVAALTDAIEKIADPDSAVLAIHEISTYRECRGRFGQRIQAEEDQDPVRENGKEKEVDPCAMMMDTTMFDESNPMLEWLNEDGEHTILDGSEAASAVFEKIRSLNSSRKENYLGRKDNSRKRTRAVDEEEEDAYNDCEDDEEEENEYIDVDDGSDDEDGEDDSASEADGEVLGQAEKDGANQVRNVIEGTSDNLGNRRSGRVRQAKKVKDVNNLYY
ncbi:hypothetical protein ACQ4PT_051273 [Festuca glaucescens]